VNRQSVCGNCVRLPAACLLAVMLGASMAEAAEDGFILNRAFTVGEGKEIDAAVRVLKLDSVAVDPSLSIIRTSAGAHVLEVSCTARVFAGMGRVDFDSRSAMTIEVEAGRTYQLGARYSVRGDCTPVLE
jgi:hypothetical protein